MQQNANCATAPLNGRILLDLITLLQIRLVNVHWKVLLVLGGISAAFALRF